MAKKPTPDKILRAKDYIVGIGASAGGLEAIHEMFDNMPEDTNMAFVLVQHLSPDYKSLMAELLSKHTAMQVYEAEDGMTVTRNCIYVIPSKKMMTVKNGKLQLHDKVKTKQPNTAIDIFFESLAMDKKECAIGVILSGTGTDGTHGIEAIKANGGVVVVQDPITAKFDGMPNSAIATGHADLILPPEMIADELVDFLKEGPLLKAFNDLTQKDESIMHEVLEIIKLSTGHDFTQYKRPTISRRLSKRMAEKNIRELRDYYSYLRANPDEVKKLCKDFLIGVTKFFRDEDAYSSIRDSVLPSVFAGKKKDDTTKAWVVACSTGEEAYSMGILFHEYITTHKLPDNVKIFATDIDKEALDIASRGVYSLNIEKDVSKERLDKYFIKEGNSYKVSPTLRRMVVFAQHDILKDPPFSKLDFISCRNMLIYMSPTLQNNIQKTFHFALNAGGYLMLGPSENIGPLRDQMTEVDKKWRIYKCVEKSKLLDHEPFMSPVDRQLNMQTQTSKSKNAFMHLSEIFKDTLLEEYKMAGIFIDRDFVVKQAVGRFKDFLGFPEGNFNFNLLKLVHPDLAVAISMCVRKALKSQDKCVLRNVKVHDKKSERRVNIVVKPYLDQKNYLQPFLFIVLSEEPESKVAAVSKATKPLTQQKRIIELEDELRDLRENLQAVVEEVEAANEELQSSNEEMISANEELQSTNEELQSLNEELHTVNAEHQLKIKELNELNDDLNNYFRNSDIGQILIDRKLIIRKFSPVVTKQINIIQSDTGRSVADLSNNFANLDFINDVKGVIKTGHAIQKEVLLKDGQVFLMKINPFVRQDKTSDGVVVSFIDIAEVKRLGSILEGVFNSSVSGIMALKAVRDNHGKINDLEWLTANSAVDKIIGRETGFLIGKRYRKEYPNSKTNLYERYVRVIETGDPDKFEFQNDEGRWFNTVVVKMEDGVVVTLTDITDQKRAADIILQNFEALQSTSGKLEKTNKALEQSNYDLMQFASVASHDLKEPLRKIQAFGNLLHAKAGNKLDGEAIYLEKMIAASNRMQLLIDDVLTLSKLSNKDIPYEKTDLNNVIKRLLDDLEITVKESNAKVKVEKLPIIQSVSGQMHQLFQNLISNALKFNDSKTPSITIREKKITKKEELDLRIDAERYTCIMVEDNGIGFEPQYHDKIFGIFQRLHGSADYRGTGIGLAICKKIVENHQGVIRAESKPGKGSTFLVYLPLKKEKVLQP